MFQTSTKYKESNIMENNDDNNMHEQTEPAKMGANNETKVVTI